MGRGSTLLQLTLYRRGFVASFAAEHFLKAVTAAQRSRLRIRRFQGLGKSHFLAIIADKKNLAFELRKILENSLSPTRAGLARRHQSPVRHPLVFSELNPLSVPGSQHSSPGRHGQPIA